MTTRNILAAGLILATLPLAGCGGSGPSKAECQDPAISQSTYQACIDKAREEIQKEEVRGE